MYIKSVINSPKVFFLYNRSVDVHCKKDTVFIKRLIFLLYISENMLFSLTPEGALYFL